MIARRSVLLAVLSISVACTPVRYLAQAAPGQLEILFGGRSLEAVIADPATPPRVRRLLSEVPKVKAFGEKHGLKATGSYREYVDLARPAVVWVVSACEPLAFKPKKWTFPIVGSVPYLGWFDRRDAEAHADELREEGWEVDVRPASAYSTLGWFDDPVLSTMLHEGPEGLGQLVNVVLHESTHATHYVNGQTAFNESIANFVGDRLAGVYLAETYGPESAAKRTYDEYENARKARRAKMHAAYARLDAVYRSDLPDSSKTVEKRLVLSALRMEIGAKRPINNATLFEFKSYNEGEKELEKLLASCGGSFPRLLAALRAINSGDFEEPQQRDLAPVFRRVHGCPT